MTLSGIQIEGGSIFPQGAFDKLWRGDIGKQISLAHVFEIAQQITKMYAQKGYALSFATVPPQKIEGGKVRIHITEGYVEKVVFTGDKTDGLFSLYGDGSKNKDSSLAEDMMQKILTSNPLTNAVLERYLLLLNDLPGVKAKASFAPSETTPNASVLTIDVKRQPISAEARLDNRSSRDMKRWTEGGSATLNGLYNGTDELTASAHCGLNCYIYRDWSANWSSFVGTDGVQIHFGGSGSSAQPPASLYKTLSFEGEDNSFSFGGFYPLIRSRANNVTLGSEATIHDSETKIYAGTLTRDKVRTIEAYGAWDFSDASMATSLIRLGLTQGMPVLNATSDSDAERSRQNGSAKFTLATLRALRIQPLGSFGRGLAAYSIFFDTQFQSTLSNPLLSASRCSYGGVSFGRGYDGGALSGDTCLMGLIEARRDDKIADIVPLQSYAFFDGGGVWQKGDLLSGEQRSLGAASTGLGVRLGQSDLMQGELQLAFPLRRSIAESDKMGSRIFLTITMKY